jgi:hypothetical protein
MTNQIQRTDMEQIQEESQTPSVDVDVTRRDIGGAEQLQASLDEIADSADVLGFKCVHEKCGLVHNHDTTKHQAGDSFDMSDSEAASMEGNSVCHCGLGEAARTGVSGAPSPDKANRMAPIPDSMERHLDSL